MGSVAEKQGELASSATSWIWPLDETRYDRTPIFTSSEQEALALFVQRPRDRAVVVVEASQQGKLARLMEPLHDALAVIHGEERLKIHSVYLFLRMCARDGRPFWAWERETWIRVLGTSTADFFTMHKPGNPTDLRQYLIAVAYLLNCFSDFQALGGIETASLAFKVFGRERVEATFAPILAVNAQWGYSRKDEAAFRSVIAETLLLNRSPHAGDLTRPFLERVHAAMASIPQRRAMVYRLSRILVHLGLMSSPLPLLGGLPASTYKAERERGIAPEWIAWVERWFTTTTRPPHTRLDMRRDLLRVGRWLAVHHPEVTTPAQFTRELAAELVAAANQMCIGDFSCENLNVPLKEPGKPWSATRKHGFLGVLRRCLTDAQEWGWMERRFNPQRVFATPRNLKHQIRVAPRTISDDIWAKLLWAGLNLRAEDCPLRGHHLTRRWSKGNSERTPLPEEFESYYPLEMIRALAILWLFSGLRSDELSRLRVGCARMQTVVTGDGAPVPVGSEQSKPVCLLDIPVHKTGRAFTKPVDPLVGEAIAAWEAVRPAQPDLVDPKTGERVQFLFCCRAKRLSKTYLNHTLIPALCQRAGIPRTDARGSISSHRARSTIASQLFNAREPMTLFELQAWLGHQSPATTQHYVSTSPTKLAQAYKDAGYFSRNVRAIEVLIDQQAIVQGQAAQGIPWRYYDLGHGWCSYEFFDQCPHRMACVRCDFYVPKASERGRWLETREGFLKMLQEIPLSDEERAAVDGDVQALDRLLERLATVPTPSGSLPGELTGTFIPLQTLQASHRGRSHEHAGHWHTGLQQHGGSTFMKMPLCEGDALIRTVLPEQWHLEARAIHFIPVGDSAYSYRVEARPNSSYYLKVVDQRMSAGRRTAAHMGFSLPLQYLVANLHLAEVNAPLPQPTITGALHAVDGPFLLALYTFIHGETLADAYPMSPGLVRQIAQALAALHAVQLPEALQLQSPQDSLTALFDTDLLTDLAALATISSHDAPYLQRLREVTWPRREQIRAFLAHSQEYARKAQQISVSAVVCHGDAWGGNMILSPSGQLTLLDWESAVMAPPERDAFIYMGYLGPEFTAFNDGYRMIRREPMHWHADWLASYAYRLQLRNLAHWLHNLLHEPLDEVQRDNDVTMIEYHCLDRLERVERTATELMARSADGRI